MALPPKIQCQSWRRELKKHTTFLPPTTKKTHMHRMKKMLPKNYTTLLAKDNVLSLFLYPKRAFDYDFRVIHLRLLRFCLTTFGLWEATYLHSQASPHLPTEKMDRKQRKNLYYKTRANKKGVSCTRHRKKSYVVFRFWEPCARSARGSLPSFLCVCFVWFICQI